MAANKTGRIKLRKRRAGGKPKAAAGDVRIAPVESVSDAAAVSAALAAGAGPVVEVLVEDTSEAQETTERQLDGAFPIVAIGGSAGALEALQRFFKAMPSDRRIAFVVIVHLDPNHVSYLSEILSNSTAMNVGEIQDGDKVEPGRVSVIPPNRFVRVENSILRLDEAPRRPIIPMPIDYFMRSLAEDQQERAIAIILTGTDKDGAQGREGD